MLPVLENRQDDVFEAGNSLLRVICAKDRALLAGHLRSTDCRPGQRLFAAGEDVTTAFFPLDGTTVALSIALADGRDVHAALFGREGAVGGIVSGGHKPAFARAYVETGGRMLVLPLEHLQRAKARSARLTDLFARYADCLFAHAMQTSACNAFHDARQRVARWLLFLQDRIGGSDIPVTQDRLAAIIGAHRVTVLRGIGPLQKGRLVAVQRGRVVVHDRQGLEAAACECRGAIDRHYRRMLPGWRLHDLQASRT